MIQIKMYLQSLLVSSLLLFISIGLWGEPSASASPSCARLFQSAGLQSAGSENSPLFRDLLKTPLQRQRSTDILSDLSGQPRFDSLQNKILTSKSSSQERLQVLHSVGIESIVAAPGHRLLRNPKQVEGLAQYISTSNGGNFQHDPLLLNVITNSEGKIQTVDLWNAHHRLVAYMKAGYKTLGDIPASNFKILVNGVTESGETWGHYLPLAGIDSAMMKDYSVVPVGGDIRLGTVSVNGQLTNFELGSRTSVGQLFKNTFRENQPRIGVYFGTFDPIHEGHIDTVKKAMQQFSLDEVVIIANPLTPHKPNALDNVTRLSMVKKRAALEEGMNVYIGDAKQIVGQFGRDPIFERISQIYGTKNIYQIIGSDSFESLISKESIKDSNHSYLVFPREVGETIPVPEDARDKVVIGKAEAFGLSSTKVREAIARGERPDASTLHPVVLQYILENHLYSGGTSH